MMSKGQKVERDKTRRDRRVQQRYSTVQHGKVGQDRVCMIMEMVSYQKGQQVNRKPYPVEKI